jgi:hypothetical protein
MANPPKVVVSGAATTTSPTLQDQITLALLQNGGIARIQTQLRQRLDEAGWSENLRNYVTGLFRSGECTTFFEAMEMVKARVGLEGRDDVDEQSAGLMIPRTAAEGGVEAVKRELESVCEIKK